MLLLIVTIACLSHNHDLSLALLYSLDLLNGIRFLKDFRAASPQRSSWRSQRRGSVASPVMIGADWKSTEIIRCPQGAQRPVDVGFAPTGAAAEKPPAGRNAPLP